MLLANARHYYPFISDDSFISFRYAERLLEGSGLTWTDGAPVEGYSNLLWTLLCAALGAVGTDLVLASRILGFLGVGAAVVAIAWAVRPRRIVEVAAALVGMLGFACSGPAGAWLVGGLEQPLVVGLLAWAMVSCAPLLEPEPPSRRQIAVPGLLLALLTLTRADGAVLVAAACAGVVLVNGLRWPAWRRGLLLAALPLAAFLGQLAFRLIYYDAWIPNTALVKVAFTPSRLQTGAQYVLSAAWSSAPLIAVGVLAAILGARQRGPRWRQACHAWVVALFWAAYVVFIGGDIFPAYRHWIPSLVAVCMASSLSLCLVAERWPRRRWIGVAIGAAAVAVFAVRQPADPQNHRAVTERWEYNGEVVGRLLNRAFGDREPLLAAAAVGSLCYYSKLPSLDMLGLNDRHIATHRPDDIGTGLIGHELGDGAYAMSRQPDLLVFCGPTGRPRPCNRGEKEMFAHPDFRRDYQLVHFRGTEPFEVVARIFVRRTGRVGIEATSDRVVVPGYLMTGGDKARAELDDRRRIGLRLPAGGKAHTDLDLAPGEWRVRVESDHAGGATLTITDLEDRRVQRAESGDVVVDIDTHGAPASRVRVQVNAVRKSHVRRLVVERRT